MDIIKQLREQAQEIAKEGHAGWGNTMVIAADEIERLRLAQQQQTEPVHICNQCGLEHMSHMAAASCCR